MLQNSMSSSQEGPIKQIDHTAHSVIKDLFRSD
uniref:Uncharacterized protein n=1 Tax=Anguilla anguilla TaxID=7936 RepID=A0A0E9PQD3_ANGAN